MTKMYTIQIGTGQQSLGIKMQINICIKRETSILHRNGYTTIKSAALKEKKKILKLKINSFHPVRLKLPDA